MGVGPGLDHVTLFDLLVKERVETFPARAYGIDLTHKREYRKSGPLAWASVPGTPERLDASGIPWS